MLETLIKSYPGCLLKVNNLKVMAMLHNFVVRPVTLCLRVHSTVRVVLVGKDRHSSRNLKVVDTF